MPAATKMKDSTFRQPRLGDADSDPRLSRLRDIIEARSFQLGDFELASGQRSRVYFDMKLTLLHPEGINLATDLILDRIQDDKVDAMGGLSMGADPIVAVLAAKALNRPAAPQSYFYVRKEVKTRGTKKQIEGNLEEGSRVVIVDDVTTAGDSALLAIRAAQSCNCHVTKVITVIDREQGAKEKFAAEGIELVWLFKRSDFPE